MKNRIKTYCFLLKEIIYFIFGLILLQSGFSLFLELVFSLIMIEPDTNLNVFFCLVLLL